MLTNPGTVYLQSKGQPQADLFTAEPIAGDVMTSLGEHLPGHRTDAEHQLTFSQVMPMKKVATIETSAPIAS